MRLDAFLEAQLTRIKAWQPVVVPPPVVEAPEPRAYLRVKHPVSRRAAYLRRLYAERRADGRCRSCPRPLLAEEIAADLTCCLTCRRRDALRKQRMKDARHAA